MKAKAEAKAKTTAGKTESKAATVSNKVSAVKDKAVGKQLLPLSREIRLSLASAMVHLALLHRVKCCSQNAWASRGQAH